MNSKKTFVLGIIIGSMLVSSAFPAFAEGSDHSHLKLMHVGLNPVACVGPFSGKFTKGEVAVSLSDKNGNLKVEVNVNGGLPNITYDVDIRCVEKIGSLKTDSKGNGEAKIALPGVPTLTPSPTPTNLGGLLLDQYCSSLGQGFSFFNGQTWSCTGNGKAINLNTVCKRQYKLDNAYAAEAVPGNVYTYQCYSPALFYVDVSVAHAGGGAGGYGDTFIAGPFSSN